jgi:hypothetical protein
MQSSGFFNSSDGDRIYAAVDFAEYFGNLVSNGIFYWSADNLKVIPNVGMVVAVSAGGAFINGYNYRNTAIFDLQISASDSANPRIDRVVLRLDMSAREIILAVLTGSPSASPSAPNLTRNDNMWELGLATVFVGANASEITAENITDTRLNQGICGLVNSLISAVYE